MAAVGRWSSVDPKADAFPGLTPYSYVEGNPVTFTDPLGLQCEGGSYQQGWPQQQGCTDKRGDTGQSEVGRSWVGPKASEGDRILQHARDAMGRFFDRLSQHILSLHDALTGHKPGTTQNAVADKLLNPPDIQPSVTINGGPLAINYAPNHQLVFYVQPSDELSVTLNATYKAPGEPSGGWEFEVGGEGSVSGFIVGGSVIMTTNGRVVGGTVSVGAGIGDKYAKLVPVLAVPLKRSRF